MTASYRATALGMVRVKWRCALHVQLLPAFRYTVPQSIVMSCIMAVSPCVYWFSYQRAVHGTVPANVSIIVRCAQLHIMEPFDCMLISSTSVSTPQHVPYHSVFSG